MLAHATGCKHIAGCSGPHVVDDAVLAGLFGWFAGKLGARSPRPAVIIIGAALVPCAVLMWGVLSARIGSGDTNGPGGPGGGNRI